MAGERRPQLSNRFGPGTSRWEPEPEGLGLITPVPQGAHRSGCLCPGCRLRRQLDAAPAAPGGAR